MVEYKQYIKDGVVRRFKIVDGKVLTTIGNIVNPTIEQFLADGWQEYTPSTPQPILPTIEELVEGKVREKYTINQEFQVNRKRETDKLAFEEYYAYVEECIAWAEQQPHREED